MHTRVHLPAYQENPKYRRLRKDNIGYFRRDSHGLCRIALFKDQGNVWFFVSLDMFEVYLQVGLFPWTIYR